MNPGGARRALATGDEIAPALCIAHRSSQRRCKQRPEVQIDFDAVGRAALARLPGLLSRWLPGGLVEGNEYVALNPRRADRRLGSFKINLKTGHWADFAIEGARGRDLVSLAAYLGGIGRVEAARRLAMMLGIGAHDGR